LCRSVVESSDGDDSRMREGIALVEHWHGAANGRIRCLMSPHAEYTTSPALIQRLIAQADRLGVGIHTHVSETQAEVAGCRARHGVSPVQYFAQLGLFDRPCIAAHCVVTDAADIRILAEKGVHVVHNPVSNLKLGSGVMPLPQMLSAGVQVCLGTDGVSSNNTLNLWEELRLTALLHKGVTNDPLAVSEAETLSMATRVGAQAMGFEKVGLLRKGFRADIILIDTTAPHWTPCLDPMANLVYATQGADVSLTMVDGRVLYQEGQYPGVDVQAIRQAVQREAVRMTQGI
ncbi:MAG: amidohydrolase family protein, partial [Clostridia bacterium]